MLLFFLLAAQQALLRDCKFCDQSKLLHCVWKVLLLYQSICFGWLLTCSENNYLLTMDFGELLIYISDSELFWKLFDFLKIRIISQWALSNTAYILVITKFILSAVTFQAVIFIPEQSVLPNFVLIWASWLLYKDSSDFF